MAGEQIASNIMGRLKATDTSKMSGSGIGSTLGGIAGQALIPIPGVGMMIGSALGGLGEKFLTAKGEQAQEAKLNALHDERRGEALAYGDYLMGLRNQSIDKIGGMQKDAEKQFLDETANAPIEIIPLANSIREQATEAQQEGMRQYGSNLAAQGVRGGQAATLMNRQAGQTTRGMQQDLTKLYYDDARERRVFRAPYFSTKAITPWKTLSDINTYMPSGTEIANMFQQKSSYRGK
jgi:hypothetical protein